MDSETLCLSQFKMQKVLKIRLGFINVFESSCSFLKVKLKFQKCWNCLRIFKFILSFLAYSWHGKLESVCGLKRLNRKHF